MPRSKVIFYLAGAGLAAWLLFSARSEQSGITGKVTLQGTPPLEIQIQFDPVSAKLHPKGLRTRHYVVAPDGGLANVFVYIKQGLEGKTFPAPDHEAVMGFHGCQIEPYVAGVRTNQVVRFLNQDPFVQNVLCTPKANGGNRAFNFALMPPSRGFRAWVNDLLNHRLPWRRQNVKKTFPAPEIFVRLKCDVHPWEFGYVAVMEHPFFAVTDKDGTFRFPPGLPPGRYVVEARHLKAGAVTQEIAISGGESKTLNFTLAAPIRP